MDFEFWDALAPHHHLIENSYLDISTIRRVRSRIQSPALVVGAGQGLVVAELQKAGLKCDGVDLSTEMIRHAKLRRGLALIEADARALPFGNSTYKTIIYATGVMDFMSDEDDIRAVLKEGKRIVDSSGIILIAFCRLSPATEKFMVRLGLLNDGTLAHREILQLYRLNPLKALRWIAGRAKVGYSRAALMAIRSWAGSSWQEKRNALQLQKVFANGSFADSLIRSAPEQLPFRNEPEIRNVFARLAIPIKRFESFCNCSVVEI
jgi:hypothetical protein